ncbi:CocE/NonD family hydrolase [Spongiivirga sp. MCCC 1A20706]|uniref:CocE/NonD family hydrolase n=1 Tax=Spongiivirga sp. MCCC 1A20706 TaxID=3160963 RepID=UPI0039774B96
MNMLKPHLLIVATMAIVLLSCNKTTKSVQGKLLIQDEKEYFLQDSIVVQTADGAEVALLIVRNKQVKTPAPTILHHTIYTRDNDYERALKAASHGYVGVVSYTRGKAWSSSEIVPYEFEGGDINTVIEWITQQHWSNGEVGMQGGSYTGFTQWAATKKLHPALKTIIPAASSSPGIGEPSENGVYMSFLYSWFPYVTNNKKLDTENYNDHGRWNKLKLEYYQNGIAYNKLDSIDGAPNPFFKKQLQHPTYDKYWQSMMPYKEDFKNIDIPVLTTTGYYDGGQIGALHYLKEHYKYFENPEHYLVIGPFGHLGSQYIPEKTISNYSIDSVAQISITDLSFQWFDYIFKSKPKPDLLKDKINFQVMGANKWRHVQELSKMSSDTLRFYLNNTLSNVPFRSKYGTGNNGNPFHYALSKNRPLQTGYIEQSVDFKDRTLSGENNYYNPIIVNDSLPLSNGFSFITKPFDNDMEFNGSYSGSLKLMINKKDMDCSIVLYEQTPEGKYFKLTQQFIGRASMAKNREKRQLLSPNKLEEFPFNNVRVTSKKMNKGSRLVLVLNVNKHPHEQVNYGTGKDVSKETIKDANEPLIVKWFNNSYVDIPVYKE